MTSTSSQRYERPPVTEVALAIYFGSPLGLNSAHLGQLWKRWRERYPRTEDHPVLPPVPQEAFSSPGPVAFRFAVNTPGPRVWFCSAVGDRLLQVQFDRLVVNWRRVDSSAASTPARCTRATTPSVLSSCER